MAIPLHSGIGRLVAGYDALILDLWGVVHDGVAPYPGVLDCLARLAAAGKRVIILSNVPRTAERAAGRLRAMGIDDGRYQRLITSGGTTREALERRDDPWFAALGRTYYYFGKDGDDSLLDGLDYHSAATPEDADFVLNTGLAVDGGDRRLEVADYHAVLRRAAGLALPMVCANPDLAVVRGGAREACAGALAAAYAALGGDVRYLGKPHPLVYEMCFEALGGIERGRILAVGDGLATDIAGARAAGLDSLLVTGGLLADAWGVAPATPPEPTRLAAACAAAGVTPTAVIPTFVW